MRVLVTGGNGFIGRHVVAELRDQGHDPWVFDHKAQTFELMGNGMILGDVRDEGAVTEAMAQVEGFIHLAGVLGTQETIQNPRPSAEVNIFGGINILQAAAQYKLPGVYIAVGNHWMNNTYSITKTTTERLCFMYNAERGTRVNVVRCVNAYGPGQVAAVPFGPSKVRKVTPSFVCRALSSMPIEVYGDGNQVSDMLYVKDLAYTLVRAIEAAAQGNVCYNPIEVGPVEHLRINDFAGLIAREASRYTGTPVPVEHLPMRPGEIPNAYVTANTETLMGIDVDPHGFVPLNAGIADTVQWFWENEGVTWHRPSAS